MTAIHEVQEVEKLMAAGAQVVEVLPRSAWEELHLPGAVSIPLAELPSRANELDRGRPVVVYCYDTQCDLSPRAAAVLRELAFTSVNDFVPGKLAWLAAGMPSEGQHSDVDRAGSIARIAATCVMEEDLASVRTRLQDHGVCVVVDPHRVVIGEIRENATAGLPGESVVADVMDAAPRTIRTNVPRAELTDIFTRSQLDHVLVTTLTGELLGLITHDDLL
jgi:rhodanese-related sulfurtransferase